MERADNVNCFTSERSLTSSVFSLAAEEIAILSLVMPESDPFMGDAFFTSGFFY